MVELIKALINVVVLWNIVDAVKLAGYEAGYITPWYNAWPISRPAPLPDMTEWLRKPVYEEITSGLTLRGYDEDDIVEYDDVVGVVERDGAVLDSLYGFSPVDLALIEMMEQDEFERLAAEDAEAWVQERARYV